MKHIGFYGSSDDLIEVDGDIREEFNGESEGFSIAGLSVTVAYSSGGVWGITVSQHEEDIPVTAENMKLSIQSRMDGDPGYSMRLDMDVPDDAILVTAEEVSFS